MAADGGSVFWVGQPLTTFPKKGSRAQMAADWWECVFVGGNR